MNITYSRNYKPFVSVADVRKQIEAELENDHATIVWHRETYLWEHAMHRGKHGLSCRCPICNRLYLLYTGAKYAVEASLHGWSAYDSRLIP